MNVQIPYPYHTHISLYLYTGHLSVEHLHLGIDVVSLLVLIQGTIVPHQEMESWVELAHIVCSPDPGFLLIVGGKAVATVGVARSHNENIVWNGLEEWEGMLMLETI